MLETPTIKRIFACGLLLLFVLAATPAWAQRPGGGRGGFGGGGMAGRSLAGLAAQKSVQKELKLSEDQAKTVEQLAEKQRESFRGLRDLSEDERRKKIEDMSTTNEKAVSETLQPDQFKRLKQISLQVQGAAAFDRSEVTDALKLTSEQKDKIKTVQTESRGKMRDAFGGGDREESRKKIAEMRKDTQAKLLAVLTTEQQATYKEMSGEPFTGELTFPGGPRRGDGSTTP
jgi:Spy/CpxP family protein refolding chaperone